MRETLDGEVFTPYRVFVFVVVVGLAARPVLRLGDWCINVAFKRIVVCHQSPSSKRTDKICQSNKDLEFIPDIFGARPICNNYSCNIVSRNLRILCTTLLCCKISLNIIIYT